MPAPIPLEPPVTRATFPVNDFVCIAVIDILLLIEYLYFGLFCPELIQSDGINPPAASLTQ
jgi:hypothetical protein